MSDPHSQPGAGTRRRGDAESGHVEQVDHPAHYGGDVPYEPIKVIEAWALNFSLGNVVKYVARADAKGDAIENLEKARWYLDREIARRNGGGKP
jgi:hypothetical protein